MILGCLRLGFSEDVVVVVCVKWPAVRPLSIADFTITINLDPASVTDRFPRLGFIILEPGNDTRSLRLVCRVVQAVIVGERDVEGVQLRDEALRQVATAIFRIIKSTEIGLPIRIPR